MAQTTIQRRVTTRLPTPHGTFQLHLYHSHHDGKEHLALTMGDLNPPHQPILARVHSECFTGDVLGSRRCDCGEQLAQAMARIAQAGQGAIIYLRQEGRGIGLLDKLKAYNLQDQGYDTVDANLLLGHQPDERDYTIAADILQDLGITTLRLMTNNPDKIARLQQLGIQVSERVALEIEPHHDNAAYLATKVERMNHLLALPEFDSTPTPSGNNSHQNGKHHPAAH